jgi:NAD(P)-dependent dehydrogenase (short-subunit alcohol dehydrogenase family)
MYHVHRPLAPVAYAQRGIRVNAVCPGLICSPMPEAVWADGPPRGAPAIAHRPMGRAVRVVGARSWRTSAHGHDLSRGHIDSASGGSRISPGKDSRASPTESVVARDGLPQARGKTLTHTPNRRRGGGIAQIVLYLSRHRPPRLAFQQPSVSRISSTSPHLTLIGATVFRRR